MSIVGRRKRNLVMAWFLGIVTASVIVGVLMTLSILDVTQLIQLNKEKKTEILVEEVQQVVASRPIEAGSVLTSEDLMTLNVPVDFKVANVLAIEELVGQECVLNIDQFLPITLPMILEETEATEAQRLYEFDYIRLPYELEIGDVIDVRIVFPNGQDYVVLSKKEVIQYERQSEDLHKGLISLLVEEEEALRMSSALVDMILTERAELYTVTYINPKSQEAAKISYPVNRSVLSILEQNPNLLAMPDMVALTVNRSLLDSALKELLDEDDEWFSIFGVEEVEEGETLVDEGDALPVEAVVLEEKVEDKSQEKVQVQEEQAHEQAQEQVEEKQEMAGF